MEKQTLVDSNLVNDAAPVTMEASGSVVTESDKKNTLNKVSVESFKPQKDVPGYFIGTRKPGDEVVIGVTLYEVGQDLNLVRLSPKTSKRARHRAKVAEHKARLNPNLQAKLEKRDLARTNAMLRRAKYLKSKYMEKTNLATTKQTTTTSNEGETNE